MEKIYKSDYGIPPKTSFKLITFHRLSLLTLLHNWLLNHLL
jgi:hypothetical protein